MHGVRIRVRSSFQPLLRHVSAHLPYHVAAGSEEAPDIDVHLRWFEAAAQVPALHARDELERIGKRHWAGADTLVWTDTVRMKNLAFHFRVVGRRLEIEAVYVYAPSKERRAKKPFDLDRRLFELTSWLVLYPLSWYLQHFRGLYLLHASAIEISGRGLVIPGAGGVGKTTTSVALVAEGGRLISENLVFHDAARVFSCYEPIRLDDASVGLLSSRDLGLEPAAIPDGAKSKNMYHVHRAAIADEVPVGWIFVPRFTSRGFVREMNADTCVERLLAFNELTREVDEFTRFAATLNLVWPTPRSLERRAEALRAFAQNAERYEIGIDRAHGVEPVLRAILARTGRAAASH